MQQQEHWVQAWPSTLPAYRNILRSYFSSIVLPLAITDFKLAESRMEEFQHAEWAGDGLVLVHQNDVYYLPDPAYPSSVERITKTGSGFVFHGLAQGIYYGNTDISLIPADQAKCFR